MWYLAIKAALSGILIAIISEVAKRYPGFGGLIASLPLVSVLGMVWLWRDKPDPREHGGARRSHILVRAAVAADVPADSRDVEARL
jgi:DNA-binding transcriptional LysR family regulator